MANDALMIPVIDTESTAFWEGTAVGELRMQRCNVCGRLRFPPRVMCPYCQGLDRGWQVMSGRGVVWSYVVPHPPLLPAYGALAPYNVVVVALEEDASLRMVGNLLTSEDGAINEIDPDSIVIGEPVRVVFCQRTGADGSVVSMPEWVLEGESKTSKR